MDKMDMDKMDKADLSTPYARARARLALNDTSSRDRTGSRATVGLAGASAIRRWGRPCRI